MSAPNSAAATTVTSWPASPSAAEQHEGGRDRRHLGDGDPVDPVHEVRRGSRTRRRRRPPIRARAKAARCPAAAGRCRSPRAPRRRPRAPAARGAGAGESGRMSSTAPAAGERERHRGNERPGSPRRREAGGGERGAGNGERCRDHRDAAALRRRHRVARAGVRPGERVAPQHRPQEPDQPGAHDGRRPAIDDQGSRNAMRRATAAPRCHGQYLAERGMRLRAPSPTLIRGSRPARSRGRASRPALRARRRPSRMTVCISASAARRKASSCAGCRWKMASALRIGGAAERDALLPGGMSPAAAARILLFREHAVVDDEIGACDEADEVRPAAMARHARCR